MVAQFSLCLLSLATLSNAISTPISVQHALDTDKLNVMGYIPSLGWTGIFTAIYVLIAAGLTWRYFKSKAKYMLAMIIGLYFFIAGLALRFVFRNNPYGIGLYSVMNSFTVLSPCAFIASIYSILGQIVGRIGGEQYMLIPSRRVALVFILSDVFTFLIQGAGAGLTPTGSADLGQKIFLVGLILQLVSFVFFCIVFARWLVLVRLREPSVWARDAFAPWQHDWRALLAALSISCICIVIRCFYRVIELSEGFFGHLATTEWYFFILDALPLAVACGVFIPCWPEHFMDAKHAPSKIPLASVASSNGEIERLRMMS